MKRKMTVNRLSIFRFPNADACELLCRKGGYAAGGGGMGGINPNIPQPQPYYPIIAF